MQPGSPAALMPPGEDWLVREVQELKRQMAELAAANPVVVTTTRAVGSAFAVPGTLTTQVSVDLIVPPGMAKVAVFARGTLVAKNTTAGTNATWLYVTIPGGGTPNVREFVVAGGYSMLNSLNSELVEGLATGGVVTCELRSNADSATSADPDNQAVLTVTAVWFH